MPGPTSRVYRGDWIVSSLLVDRAERFGDDIAVSTPEADANYSNLVERAGRVGAFLAEIGIEPGDRVATMLPSTLDYVAAWHGIVWRNAIDVPINNEYKGLFLEHILRDSGAKAIIIDAAWVDRLAQIELSGLEHVVVVGEVPEVPAGIAVHSFAAALAADPAPLVPRNETDLTYIMYTSGTTGPAKGVVHNNRSSIHYIMPFVEGLDLTDDDVCYSMFPLFHQMGRSACSTTAIWMGNRIALRRTFSVSGFWDDIVASGATWMGYFGAVIAFLSKEDPSPRDRSHTLTRAFGASAPPELMQSWTERFGVKLYETYGSTEVGLGSGLGSGPPKLGTMGLPCRQVELMIADADDNRVPSGVIGEALWRPRQPDAIFQGYWNRPQATIEAFRNLWFHSGDAGLIDNDGYFIFKDRIKDSIRRRGENISTFDVEMSVRAEAGVLECAAYAVGSDIAETEEDVMIAVVPDPDSTPDVETLFRRLCETMPRHAVPRYLRFVDELPRTPTQRIQKFKLREAGITSDAHDREAMGIIPLRS
jgi:crotonobetaine/carnitine-CoA ligase